MPANAYPLKSATSRSVLTGVAIAAAAVGVSALLARGLAPPEDAYVPYSDFEEEAGKLEKPKRTAFGIVWAPAFLALTLSGHHAPYTRAQMHRHKAAFGTNARVREMLRAAQKP